LVRDSRITRHHPGDWIGSPSSGLVEKGLMRQ
jgi:hypothetical protein